MVVNEYSMNSGRKESAIIDLPLDSFWDANQPDEPDRNECVYEITEPIMDAYYRYTDMNGNVDVERIAASTGMTVKAVIAKLRNRGLLYRDPAGWSGRIEDNLVIPEIFFSGRGRNKLKRARLENMIFPGEFEKEIRALEDAIPPEVTVDEVVIRPWLASRSMIDRFINYAFQLPFYLNYSGTVNDSSTGSWYLSDKGRFSSIKLNTLYGTEREFGICTFEKTLNNGSYKVVDEIRDPDTKSGYRSVINEEATEELNENIRQWIRRFEEWVRSDPDLLEEYVKQYNDRLAGLIRPRYDGRYLTFPGMSDKISLYDYQKDFIAAIIRSRGCKLLALKTGSGKTFIMIAAAMKLKQLYGLKCMFVVPNIVEQWRKMFLELYPEANLLCIETKDVSDDRINSTLVKVRENSYDGIIISYKAFEKIPLSRKHYVDRLSERKSRIERRLKDPQKATPALKRELKKVERQLGEAAVASDAAKSCICFDELGIDQLFVDESHFFKNLGVEGSSVGVGGLGAKASNRAKHMFEVVREIQSKNAGGGVVFASATPAPNSITDLFNMQCFLQGAQLEMLGLGTFDSWAGTFTERSTEWEIAPLADTIRLKERFNKYINMPEYAALLSQIVLFKNITDEAGGPQFDGYRKIVIPASPEYKAYVAKLSERADRIRNRLVRRTEDNMLKIFSDERKASLDMQLIDENIRVTGRTKISECALQIAGIYHRTAGERLTQLVFCDLSTPKKGFNVYDKLREQLIGYGVDPSEIAFIHSARNEKQREAFFDKFRRGEIRVLLGSTQKLGHGVNIQDRCVALHHLDMGWRPADMIQRDGRILRRGNLNKKVEIFVYIMESGFDGYVFQLLEAKANFIQNMLYGTVSEREADDIGDIELTYAEIKALAVGNPELKERIEISNEITRLSMLRKLELARRRRMERRKAELPAIIRRQREGIEKCTSDAAFVMAEIAAAEKQEKGSKKADKEKRRQERKLLTNGINNNAMRDNERTLMQYRGFFIILPADMDAHDPYIYLAREGKYRLDLSDNKELGVLVRVDNYIDKLGERVLMLERKLAELEKELKQIELELGKSSEFVMLIESKKRELAGIDERLGITNE